MAYLLKYKINRPVNKSREKDKITRECRVHTWRKRYLNHGT